MYTSFDEYLEYIERLKNQIPTNVYEFATNINRHNIQSPHSLHDSWITSINIKENRNKERPFNPVTTIKIELLGQMHDRNIILEYEEVESYTFEGVKNPHNCTDTYHGDIACHEVRLTENNFLVHEILMASKAVIKITCKFFTCSEQVFNPNILDIAPSNPL